MSSNRWADICDVLKEAGYKVYSPAQHEGECKERYIVVKISSSYKVNDYSSVQPQYDIMLYIPKNEYSQFEDFLQDVKNVLKKLEPMIMPLHSQTPSYYDDQVKGHMISIQYRNNRKI